MRISMLAAYLVAAVFCQASHATVVILLDEEFLNGTGPTNTSTATWSQTDSDPFEVYNNAGFAVRGISGGATPSTPLGGLEVLAGAAANVVTISVLLPVNLDDTVDGDFFFLAGQRIEGSSGGFEGDLEIVNITDSRTIRSKAAVDHPNFTMAVNNVSVDFLPGDAGDTLEFKFYESAGIPARGLQLANLQFEATIVPEPSMVAVTGLASLAMLAARRRWR